jgi:predicted helicase
MENLLLKTTIYDCNAKIYGGAAEQMDNTVISMDNEKFYRECIHQYNTGNTIVDHKLTEYQLVTMCANN